MCGIVGIISLDGATIKNAFERTVRMNKFLHHRGPDGSGVYVSEDMRVALGNTRLAITDPMNSFDLPFRTKDSKKILTFNGEIYDYLEHRKRFESKGAIFETRTDTEVLLYGLGHVGENFINKLDGMWAFAFYDSDKNCVLLSRDILGERHVFYRITSEEFIFASEPTPILMDSHKPESVNWQSLVSSLRYGIGVPGSTLVDGIDRMLPGQNIKIEVGRGLKQYSYRRLHPEKWFDFFDSSPGYDDVLVPFSEIMTRVSSRRLPRDVEYISTLSGGIDSTLVCLYASEFGGKSIKTLYGKSGADYPKNLPNDLNEFEASVFTSSKLKTNHKQIEINADACIPLYKRFASNGFDGMLDPTVTSFEMLAHQTSSLDLKVILISNGPDEFAGGYPSDLKLYKLDCLRKKNPLGFFGAKIASGSKIGRGLMGRFSLSDFFVPSGLQYEPFRFEPLHQQLGPAILSKIVDEESIRSTDQSYSCFPTFYSDIENQLDYTQMRALSYASYIIPDFTNLQADKGFYPASVESRSPLLAPELVEFLIAMPASYRFNQGDETKSFLRYVVDKFIGPQIGRRSKHGFSEPLYRTPSVRSALNIEEVISDTRIFEDLPFKPNVKKILGNPSMEKLVWPLYVIALTYEQMRAKSSTGYC